MQWKLLIQERDVSWTLLPILLTEMHNKITVQNQLQD